MIEIFVHAFLATLYGDAALWDIILLSLWVSCLALAFAAVIGLLLSVSLTMFAIPGKQVILLILHSLLGLPPVVVGLLVYIVFSQSGPLGELNILFTPTAMVIAQVILVVPIIAAYGYDSLLQGYGDQSDFLRSLGASRWRIARILLYDHRYHLVLVMLHGFGRAISEVGAVMIVGGNILHYTRVMTSSITLLTAQGKLTQALALGIVLLLVGLMITLLGYALRYHAAKQERHMP